jgi:hypothetical protein
MAQSGADQLVSFAESGGALGASRACYAAAAAAAFFDPCSFADRAKERQPPYGVAVSTRQVALPPT